MYVCTYVFVRYLDIFIVSIVIGQYVCECLCIWDDSEISVWVSVTNSIYLPVMPFEHSSPSKASPKGGKIFYWVCDWR